MIIRFSDRKDMFMILYVTVRDMEWLAYDGLRVDAEGLYIGKS